jgi:hypothetical protein
LEPDDDVAVAVFSYTLADVHGQLTDARLVLLVGEDRLAIAGTPWYVEAVARRLGTDLVRLSADRRTPEPPPRPPLLGEPMPLHRVGRHHVTFDDRKMATGYSNAISGPSLVGG